MSNEYIDISFDVRTDSGDRDADSYSRTLKRYHKALWSKALPNGKMFDLVDTRKREYLVHKSDLGEFFLTSDSIVHTYFKWECMEKIIHEVPKDSLEKFYNMAHTVGGYIVFPCNQVNKQYTINQARGVSRVICDRIDLTLECIRLFYLGEGSPLGNVIERYREFFNLFTDFKGYCEFFLLQDLVSDDFLHIKFFLPFADFSEDPLPKSLDEYYRYMESNIDFLTNRNNRIRQYSVDTFTSPA